MRFSYHKTQLEQPFLISHPIKNKSIVSFPHSYQREMDSSYFP